jgi:hypothetical protein
MISFNLDEIVIKPELLSILEELKYEKDSILLYDLPEGSRLWPLDEEGFSYILFSKAHELLKDHEFDVWYLCSDANIKTRYIKWCKRVGVEKKFNVLYFPFTVRLDSLNYISLENINNLNNTQKKKNFIQLISSPSTSRISTVNRYYKHRNYDYSLVPQFHNDPENKFEIENRTLTEIKLSDIWINDVDGGKKFKDSETIIVNGKKLNKYIFNAFLPKESFESCCDVVLETYLDGPTYITEKTWKQFLFQQPFIMVGAKGINHYLQDLGFELYDEIFDYDYDLEDNKLTRLKGFWTQIERYLDLDVSEFEKKLTVLKKKLIYNRNIYIRWISNINNTLIIGSQSTKEPYIKHDLLHYLYLSSSFHEKEYLSNDEFNIIKKICLGFN